jgi:hypothetical protein
VDRLRYGLLVILAGTAGLAGGMIGERIARPEAVGAQEAESRGRILTAETFVLVDKDGKPLARLGPSAKGAPRLEFLDTDGKPLLGTGLMDDGWPEIRLSPRDGKGVLSLFYKDGSPRVLLSDKSGRMDTVLAATTERAHLVLYKEGKARATLALDGLDLLDQRGKGRARLFTGDDGEPILDFKDKEGRRRLSLAVHPLPKEEEPVFALYDKKDTVRAGLSLDESGRPSLILRDRPLLSLIDKSGEDGLFMSLEREDRPSFLVTSKKGKHSAFLGLRENKEMTLDLLDHKNRVRASVLLNADGDPAINLRDPEQKVVWSATLPAPKAPEPLPTPADPAEAQK